ncbi:MAG: hypothetical protein ACKOX2_11785 [Microcystaceae cyanobacterium]
MIATIIDELGIVDYLNE